ncbi:hypothetical protein HB904_16810 [Listeria booriae]|uniref:Uncharacterized protein n=1 Tax=Listeria booriae TaxID=1552123 RepID=A0A841YQG7_9LIST|nr:hypothetical protein [Listeria booriae]MBC1402108.1 hypothetical protein [Listeria booriae]MBC1617840.1 hypothetical protein [Listeria booriae]
MQLEEKKVMTEHCEKAVAAEILEIVRKNGLTLANLSDVVARVEMHFVDNAVLDASTNEDEFFWGDTHD